MDCFAAQIKNEPVPVDVDTLAWSASQCINASHGYLENNSDIKKALKYLYEHLETSKAIKKLAFDCEHVIKSKNEVNKDIGPYLEAGVRKGDKTAIDLIRILRLNNIFIFDKVLDLDILAREKAYELKTDVGAADELWDIQSKITKQSISERSKSLAEAKILYDRIDKEKYPLANCIYGNIFDNIEEHQNAIHYWELCANSGYPRPAFSIAAMYEKGDKVGVKKNLKKAIEWYEIGLKNSSTYIDNISTEYLDNYKRKLDDLKRVLEFINDYETN